MCTSESSASPDRPACACSHVARADWQESLQGEAVRPRVAHGSEIAASLRVRKGSLLFPQRPCNALRMRHERTWRRSSQLCHGRGGGDAWVAGWVAGASGGGGHTCRLPPTRRERWVGRSPVDACGALAVWTSPPTGPASITSPGGDVTWRPTIPGERERVSESCTFSNAPSPSG